MSLTERSMGELSQVKLGQLGIVLALLITSNLYTFVFHRVAHVEKAADALAIDTLLISDKLFRWLGSSTSFNFNI